ncbi:hypothetical protein L1887_38113 [Cichorium endivia]|nr:hypothetical protein L1887_38113 [Cichorium endivia]
MCQSYSKRRLDYFTNSILVWKIHAPAPKKREQTYFLRPLSLSLRASSARRLHSTTALIRSTSFADSNFEDSFIVMQNNKDSTNDETHRVRKLEITDKNKGFMELLQQLTVCDPVTDDEFQNRFKELESYGDDHVICVIEDATSSKIIATGSVFIEKKFIRGCGKVGHIEDIVVDSSARGLQLGKKVVNFLADHARSTGC